MDDKRCRAIATVMFWVLIALLALLPAFIPSLAHTVAFNTVSMIVAVLAVGAWVHFDARVQGGTVGPMMRLLIVLFAIVTVPVYVFHTRGMQPGIVWLFKVAGVFLVLVLLIGIGLVAAGASGT